MRAESWGAQENDACNCGHHEKRKCVDDLHCLRFLVCQPTSVPHMGRVVRHQPRPFSVQGNTYSSGTQSENAVRGTPVSSRQRVRNLSGLPIIGISMQVHNRHHDEHVRPLPKKNAKRESLCKATTDIEFDDRVKMRINDDPVDGFLNCCKKPFAEAGLLRFVVSGGFDHLGFCARMELDRFHTNAANASANTFSARRSSTAPRSSSAQR